MSNPDSEGFKHVSYKKGKKAKKKKKIVEHYMIEEIRGKCIPPIEDRKNSIELDPAKIRDLQGVLEKTEFFIDFKESLNIVLKNHVLKSNEKDLNKDLRALSICDIDEIDLVCYGLGPFSLCMNARHQLAFLLALKDFLETRTVSIYDPLFTNEEKCCLNKLGLSVLDQNEKAKRLVFRRTIFFMPHCDMPLYNNLLWSNWRENQIAKVIIIGNSFSNYTRIPDFLLNMRGRYVNLANKFISEVKMLNNYEFKDIFNDMSIHYFLPESLSKVSDKTWLNVKEPVYLLDDDSINYS